MAARRKQWLTNSERTRHSGQPRLRPGTSGVMEFFFKTRTNTLAKHSLLLKQKRRGGQEEVSNSGPRAKFDPRGDYIWRMRRFPRAGLPLSHSTFTTNHTNPRMLIINPRRSLNDTFITKVVSSSYFIFKCILQKPFGKDYYWNLNQKAAHVHSNEVMYWALLVTH